MSNLLGDTGPVAAPERSAIIASGELIAREGVNLHKSMNFRDKGLLLCVFLVLEKEDGFHDTWDKRKRIYTFEGHDSTTVEQGALEDQVLMYESGKLSDNGKFKKAAQEYIDGSRRAPLQVQIYEKLDAGVWYDKGIFELIGAKKVEHHGRKIFTFYLQPSGRASDERMLDATSKKASWQKYAGRCATCKSQDDLYFLVAKNTPKLVCGRHSGRKGGLL